jgi:hypothetical protein
MSDWQRRANAKEFKVGDVIVVLKPGCGALTKPGDSGAVKWSAGGAVGIEGIGASYGSDDQFSLLRPVDWEPEIGERVVCIEKGQPRYLETVNNRNDRGSKFNKRYAPAILAEPLIPLLRGDKEKRVVGVDFADDGPVHTIMTAHSDGRLTVDGKYIGAEPPSPCPRCSTEWDDKECKQCGWPGLRSVVDAPATIVDAVDAAAMTAADDTRAELWGYRPVSWTGGTGETIPTQRHRERWTDEYYHAKHCKRCGSDTGCFCPRGE